jgi:Ca2+-binding RTX toxin-like protein
MLYSFTLDAGILRLTCDATSQNLFVTLVNNNIRATLSEGASQLTQQEWARTSVTRIQIVADDGNDLVNVSNDIKISAFIAGGNGNDTLIGGGGNDCLGGGAGNDQLDGQGGGDGFIGGGGDDTVDYSRRTGNLTINQNVAGADGESGENDNIAADVPRILCGSGNDNVIGSNAINVLNYIHGGEGNDTLNGMAGNDTLVGSGGNDKLYGGEGRDLLRGETGKDYLNGNSGNDTLMGGKGIDSCYGEAGDDRFYDLDRYIDILDGGKGTDSIINADSNDRKSSFP